MFKVFKKEIDFGGKKSPLKQERLLVKQMEQ